MTQTAHQTHPRIHWMDSVRGTAILLLLLWHASAVPEMLGQEMPGFIRQVNAFFMPYRMPTLMLLSGMLLTRSLQKPLPQYYAGKFGMILWPYVIWVIIAKLAFLEVVGMPWWHWRAWYATSYLWFLFFIGVYYLVAPVFRRLPPWVPVALAAFAGLLLPYGTIEQRMAYFAVFFFAGSWLASHGAVFARLASPRAALVFVAPVFAFGVAATLWTDELQYAVWGAPASIAGCLLLAALYSLMDRRGSRMRVLRFAGMSSIVFYVSHFPAMALLSESLAGVHPLAMLAINFGVALGVGSLLALTKKRRPVRWLFEAPAPLTAAVRWPISRLTR